MGINRRGMKATFVLVALALCACLASGSLDQAELGVTTLGPDSEPSPKTAEEKAEGIRPKSKCAGEGCPTVHEQGSALHDFEKSLDSALESPEDEAKTTIESSLSGLRDELDHLDQPNSADYDGSLATVQAQVSEQGISASNEAAADQIQHEEQNDARADRESMENNMNDANGDAAAMNAAEDELDAAGDMAEQELTQDGAEAPSSQK